MMTRTAWTWGMGCALVCAAFGAQAQAPVAPDVMQGPPGAAGIVDMEVVVVSGSQPGPGLWRVRRGENTLYILGTQSPLPTGITWRSEEVRDVLAEAGVVLGQPGVRFGSGIGVLRGLTMVPSAMRAVRNPEGATLDEVLPADVYARWATLKQRYIGRDRGVERKRPAIAVFQLYRAALEANGLREGGVVGPVVEEVLKARGMSLTSTMLEVKVDDPRQAMNEFRKEGMKPEDLACVRDTLDIIERGLPQVAARANAWAVGDLDTLRSTAGQRRQVEACMSAWLQSGAARKRGLDNLDDRVRAHWVAAAQAALSGHRVSFATLSVDDMLGRGGYLAALQAHADVVLAPDEPDSVEEDTGDAAPGL